MRTIESPTASGKRKIRYEEITDLPDIVIEVFDDGAGVNEEPAVGGMEDLSGKTYEYVTSVEEGKTETLDVSDDYRAELSGDSMGIDEIVDIEKMSVEIETGDFSEADAGLSTDSVTDELTDVTGTEQSEYAEGETVDSRAGAIDDLPAGKTIDIAVASGVEEDPSHAFFSESLGISTESGLKKNRINGISEPEAMSGTDRHSFDALVNDVFESRVLDDEFVILQSDIEHEQSSQPPEEAIEERKTQEPAPEEVRRREKRISEIIIDISAEDRRKFASDFHAYDFKAIDLEKAEKIALEDIVFLSQEDLVEELEEIDLVPVESRDEVDIRIVMEDEVFQNDIDVLIREMETDGLSGDERIETRVVVETDEIVPPVKIESEAGLAESRNVVDENDIPESDSNDEAVDSDAPVSTVDEDRAVMMPVGETDAEMFPEEKPVTIREQSLNNVHESHPVPVYEEHVFQEQGKEPVTHPAIEHQSAAEDAVLAKEPGEETRAIPAEDAGVTVPDEEKEILPEELKNITLRKNARIIDDQRVEKDILTGDEKIFDESDLDRITSSIVEVVEGNSIIMNEAKIEEDKENIAAILSGTAMAFEDLLTELEDELVFSDEDIGFLDKSFASDDFLREGKKAFETRGKTEQSKMTSAVEYFGLDGDEITTIEGAVFAREFQNVDLKSITSSARAAYEQPPEDREMIKKYEYLVAHDNVMDERERESVEADISVHHALILEEDIDEIREKYAALSTKKIPGPDEVCDISDKVFILDNEDDVKRFTDTLPPDKRISILKLLTYLDGLFEKLPEDVIKRFAESEYYNLYTQVLQDLDK